MPPDEQMALSILQHCKIPHCQPMMLLRHPSTNMQLAKQEQQWQIQL
jgi:hypothetical protein